MDPDSLGRVELMFQSNRTQEAPAKSRFGDGEVSMDAALLTQQYCTRLTYRSAYCMYDPAESVHVRIAPHFDTEKVPLLQAFPNESQSLPRQLPFDLQRQFPTTLPHHILKTALKHNIRHLVVVDIPRILGLFRADLDRVCACLVSPRGPSSRRSISQELRLDTSVESAEQECSAVDGLRHREEAVVLQDDGFGVAERLGDMFALGFLLERDSTEALVDAVVFVESDG